MDTFRLVASVFAAALVVACSNEPAPREPAQGVRIEGEVIEQIDGPPYSYLRIATENGEVWAAVPVSASPRPKKVAVVHGVALKQYRAATIGRTFETMVFGTLETR